MTNKKIIIKNSLDVNHHHQHRRRAINRTNWCNQRRIIDRLFFFAVVWKTSFFWSKSTSTNGVDPIDNKLISRFEESRTSSRRKVTRRTCPFIWFDRTFATCLEEWNDRRLECFSRLVNWRKTDLQRPTGRLLRLGSQFALSWSSDPD